MLRKGLFFLFLLSGPAWASHIVGGEFELLHINGEQYRLNMILYFDVINGNPGARDPNVTVRIFRKSDNAPILDVILPFLGVSRVDYFQPACSNGEIITDKIIYSNTIILAANRFDDPGGYYIAWERCCRNYNITNIYSENPQGSNPNYAGQTFYLEFPAVVKDGKPFINSSPQLFPPLNDYACPNRPYWVDFAGVDVDGDSIAYSLVTPRNTTTSQALPPGGPNPGPYPPIRWRPGFSLDSITGGSPDLKISSDGFITVTPNQQGLYVFAVKAEEYRKGEKIGEVIRDFQMLVLDKCPVARPPVIKGKMLNGTTYDFVDNMTVVFPHTTPDDERCINVEVSDPDASSPDDAYSETINLQVVALDQIGDVDVNQILPQVHNATLDSGATATFNICFPRCPFVDRPYRLGVIAFDDACALPLSDTLRVTVDIEPPPNTPAYFTTNDATVSVKEGDDYILPIEGWDDEDDSLRFEVLTNGFELADFGMSIDTTILENGHLAAVFKWQTGCDIIDFTSRTFFLVDLVLDDQDLCDFGDPDTLKMNLQVILPPNTDPIISSDIGNTSRLSRLNDAINFNVSGFDSDKDDLELSVSGDGFNLQDYGIVFDRVTGNTNVSAPFSWVPDCSSINLDDRSEFRFYFVLNDLDKCKFSNFDSLTVDINLLPPDNHPPVISLNNLNEEVTIVNREVEMTIGDFLDLEIQVNDADNDGIVLELLESDSLPDNFTFKPTSGTGSISSPLQWTPECRNLQDDFTSRSYQFTFVSRDDICYSGTSDTLKLHVDVKDIDAMVNDFLPPNVFTPNKDGVNEEFTIPNLPEDNCTGHFLSFTVFNRWGTEVFQTTDRNFKWDGNGVKSGVYYYSIKFSNAEYQGPLSVLY